MHARGITDAVLSSPVLLPLVLDSIKLHFSFPCPNENLFSGEAGSVEILGGNNPILQKNTRNWK